MWGEGTVLDVDVGPNLYTYVRQNPWTKFDPLGLTDEEIWLRSTGKLNAQGLAPGTPYRPPQGLSPRIAGGLQMVGGGAEAAVGLLAVSTGGGAIPGLIAIAHGYDNMQTGLNQMVTGKPQTTMTHQAIRAGLKKAGVSEGKAEMAAMYADVAIGMAAPIKSGLIAKANDATNIGANSARGINTQQKLIGVTNGEANALGSQFKGISVNGAPAVSSVEAFGSRAGSTFRGRPPTPTSDLDVFVTLDSNVVNSAPIMRSVQSEIGEIAELFEQAKKIPVRTVTEIDTIAPSIKRQLEKTPFIPIGE